MNEHMKNVSEIQKAKSATSQADLESRYGMRYSELCFLYLDIYYSISRDRPDAQYFLELAKHFIETLKSIRRLTYHDFECIQTKVDSIIAPSHILAEFHQKLVEDFHQLKQMNGKIGF